MNSTSILNPQSLNLYAYVENNPVDFVDPTGLFRFEPGPKQPEEPDWEGFFRFLMDSLEFSRGPWISYHEEGGGGGGGGGGDDGDEEWRKCRAQADADFDPYKPKVDADKLKSYNTAIARANEDFMEEVRNKNEDFWETVKTTLTGAVIGGFVTAGAGGLIGGEIGATLLNPGTILLGIIGGALIGAVYGVWVGARRKDIDLSREKGKFDKAVRRAKEDYPEVLPFLDWAERKSAAYSKCDRELVKRRLKPF